MTADPMIRRVFGPFQNLNLLVLVEDLRRGEAGRHQWSSGSLLCPVAHGLAAGREVADLRALDQGDQLGRACDYAARRLGADFTSVQQFVRLWDAGTLTRSWLLHQLQGLWGERLADAEAVQELIQGAPAASWLDNHVPTPRSHDLRSRR